MREDLLIRPHYAYFLGKRLPVSIGRGGIGRKRGEGDGVTPIGIWQVESWLYRADRLANFGEIIGPQMRWIDDPKHPHYNQPTVENVKVSHERMHRADPFYDVVGVVNFNRDPIVSGAGRAIFIHQWRKPRHPTEGCIAFSRPVLFWIAQNWHPSRKIIIQA